MSVINIKMKEHAFWKPFKHPSHSLIGFIYFLPGILIYTASVSGGPAIDHAPYWEQPFSQPYFDNSTKRDVVTTVGQSAYLYCRVRNLGDRAVSWIRKRDLHILTVGILTYTNDQRFQSLHSDGTDEWTLKISSPQIRDSGTYECQVSTEPKISQAFRLNVVVSKAKILGNPELYIKSGSDINLTCVVLQTPEPPSFIYWYQGGHVVNYSQRGGINVVTEKQTRTSRLLIARALPADSGNYTCAPSSSDSASVIVHVLNGEHPAAMQHGNSSSNALPTTPGTPAVLFIHYILLRFTTAVSFRVNQRYVMDVKNFLLVEILLCILLIILTKGIFEVKLSKLQFAISQTENAAKYLNLTKEDFVRKNAFFSKRFSFVSGKPLPKKSSLPSDLDKSVQRSAISSVGFQTIRSAPLSNISSTFFSSKAINNPDYKSFGLNSSASDSCGSNANSCPDNSFKRASETDTKKTMQCPSKCYSKQDLSKPIAVNASAQRNKSQTTCLLKEKVNSTGTFTVKSSLAMSIEQQASTPSKTSKSVVQGLNTPKNTEPHVPGPSAKPNSVNIVKSLSQALTPPTNSPKQTPIKALRSAARTVTPDKAFKSKSQDLWTPPQKRFA